MTMERGNPVNVRVGPGKLYIAPLDAEEPDDLVTDWDEDFEMIGYTAEGSNFVFDNTFEDVNVAEELEPVAILQTARQITVNFASAEITAENLRRAFNGGEVQTPTGLVTFEPPPAGEFTYAKLGWESDDGLERWVFRKCIQVGSIDMARRRAPANATIPMSFRCVKPDTGQAFLFIQSADYAELGS